MTVRFVTASAVLAILVTGCVAATSTPPVEPPQLESTEAPDAAAPDAPAHAARRAPSEEDACWARFVNYCPDDGPATCLTKDGVKTLDACSSMGGHCLGNDPEHGRCVKGPAAVCDGAIPDTGDACTGSTSCSWMSRMGVAQCDCKSGRWDCGKAGI